MGGSNSTNNNSGNTSNTNTDSNNNSNSNNNNNVMLEVNGPSLGNNSDIPTTTPRLITTTPSPCPPGMAMMIDIFGADDFENTDTCHYTVDAAQVVSCNDEAGAISMKIRMLKALFTNGLPEGFTDDEVDADYVSVTYTHESSETSWTSGAGSLDLSTIISLSRSQAKIQDQQIFTGDGDALEFMCQYSLDDVDAYSDPYTVTGGATVTTIGRGRAAGGTLGFTIDVENKTFEIGKTINYVISPVNTGLLNARAKECVVVQGENTAIILGEEGHCRNSVVDFTIGDGWAGTGDQYFNFKSFKWSDGEDDEEQSLRCKIELSSTPFEFVSTHACGEEEQNQLGGDYGR